MYPQTCALLKSEILSHLQAIRPDATEAQAAQIFSKIDWDNEVLMHKDLKQIIQYYLWAK